MPLFEFECECGEKLELIQKFDDELPKCKICKKEMKRVISKCSFKLKGECWAKDGYTKKNKKRKKK